ncbi:ATP-binding protein [Streptomyces sp. NPDC059382]|uniref:ATP-binding protein n=1 Tax=Streptomyces sp. NPDC059382 TaxID=3346816 RepID=UPI00367AB3DA
MTQVPGDGGPPARERVPTDVSAGTGPALPATVAEARDIVAVLLENSGLPSDAPVVTDALMVTSELVTNAIRHGGGLTGFHADVRDGDLRVSVADRNPVPPVTQTSPPAGRRIGGYGWPLVRTLADRVTVTPHEAGKHITATLRLG